MDSRREGPEKTRAQKEGCKPASGKDSQQNLNNQRSAGAIERRSAQGKI